MDDLVTWLRAQIDEDERAARTATAGPWWYNPGKQWLGPEDFERYNTSRGEEFVGYGGPSPFTGCVAATGPADHPQSMADATFIAQHDPARVLREVEAKRRIIDWCADRLAEFYRSDVLGGWPKIEAKRDAEDILSMLALPYADRTGYRDEWRP